MKNMTPYGTLSETMNALRGKGYTEDFNLQRNFPECQHAASKIFANEFKVDKYYRFEGESNPSDAAILYAISSHDDKVRGLLVNAYGIYSNPRTDEFLKGLGFR